MSIQQDGYSAGGDTNGAVYGDEWKAQTFIAQHTYEAESIKVYLNAHTGTPTGTVTVSLYATNPANGLPDSVASSGTLAIGSVTESAWNTFTLSSSVMITAETIYAVVVSLSAGNAANCINWFYDQSGEGFPGQTRSESDDGGTSWEAKTGDMLFQVWGSVSYTYEGSPRSKAFAVGNDEFWYESTSGTLTELAAANGNIDTGRPISYAEAFEKIYLANETNLNVVDFGNIKFTTADIAPAGKTAPSRGDVLVGVTSGAEMVVDFISATDGAASVYGKSITDAKFSSGETVKVGDGTTTEFTTNSAESDGPHWYDWKAYGADTTTYGSMPASATLVCRYRGRLVLSGNTRYPHQYWMARVVNPYDWLRAEADDLSPVVGSPSDVGGAGDIIKALIPYGDDYLLFGCANSMHLLSGDPASGGRMDEIDDSVGIFGSKAWCKDAQGNLYFLGTKGLYLMAGGREKPVSLTTAYLPQMMSDWSPDLDDDRVILSYDPDRDGIIISKVNFSSGANSCYWYSLKTKGFYPCSFPNVCGFYSATFYTADAATNRKVLYGSSDGYVRCFVDTAKNDDAGASDTAISSYVGWVEKLGEEDSAGKLTSLDFDLAGGAADGAYSDTDGVSYALYPANNVETAFEDMRDGADAFTSGTVSGVGRKNKILVRAKGGALGVKLYNTTASETWAVNHIYAKTQPAGRLRV